MCVSRLKSFESILKLPLSKTTAARVASLLVSVWLMMKSVKIRLHSGTYFTSGIDFSRGPEPISYSTSMVDFAKETEMRLQSQIVALIGI